MKKLLLATALTGCLALLTACPPTAKAPAETPAVEEPAPAPEEAAGPSDSELLQAALDAQSDANKARYQYRNPKETLEFFGIKPGMAVADVLPGGGENGGYYSRILIDYLGDEGTLVGVDYNIEMWPLFGGFATEEFLEGKKTWAAGWIEDAKGWRGDAAGPAIGAGTFGAMPESANGTLDAILMIRAVHHLNRFEEEGGFFTQATQDMYAALKPGGIVGIVGHRGPEENDDVWAEGDNGYNKQSQIIAFMENAGFELAGTSEINANPKDQPTNEDMVWRLPPTLGTSRDNEELRAEMQAIGESDRMTLKFKKPE
jgi:predicted methyltransferase